MKTFAFVICMLVCLATGWAELSSSAEIPRPAASSEETPVPQEDVYQADIRERFGSVQTLRTDFTQEKRMALLNEPLVSKGFFAFSKNPARIRWEYTEPFQNGFILDGDKTYRLEKGVKKAVKNVMTHNMAAQMLAWLTFDLEELSKTYEVEYFEGGVALRPKPAKTRVLEKITAWFSPDNPQALQKIRMEEIGGDVTVLTFENPQINPALTEDAFK